MKRSFSDEKNVASAKIRRDENDNIALQSISQEVIDKMFRYLSLNDLCSLNEAGMKIKTGDYFAREYESKRISVRMTRNGEIGVQPEERYVECFAEYIQDINIFGSDIRPFQYVAHHLNKSPKKIRFTNLLHTLPTVEYGECLKETLKNVEIVEFSVSRLSGNFLNTILKYCNAMKSLRIRSQWFGQKDRTYNVKCDWFHKKYPTLESIQWDDGVKYQTREMKEFFKNNPSVKNFTVARNAKKALQFILDSNIRLDQLTIKCMLYNKKYSVQNIGQVCDLVKELYGQKRIKRFQLVPSGSGSILHHSMHHLSSVKVLKEIFLIYCGFGRINPMPSIAMLTNLKILYIVSLGDNAKMFAEKLTNLEELFIERDSINAIIPFATQSPNIKRIAITNINDHVIQLNIFNLMKQRERLRNAKKLDVFINEIDLLILPEALSIDHKDVINFKRFESLQINHPFYNYRESD